MDVGSKIGDETQSVVTREDVATRNVHIYLKGRSLGQETVKLNVRGLRFEFSHLFCSKGETVSEERKGVEIRNRLRPLTLTPC